MYALLAAATTDPMSATMSSGWFRNLLTMVLIGIAALALFAPTLLAKIKAWITNTIAEQTRNLQTSGGTIDAAYVPQPAVNVSDVVKQRAMALKNACPKSDPALRLKWLEMGYGPEEAKTDYIATLETQVKVPEPVV